jgi:hypothetical protein
MFYKIPAQKAIEVEPEEGDSIEALTIDHHDYVDVPEPIPTGKGGRPGDPRLVRLAIRCHTKDDPKKRHHISPCRNSQGVHGSLEMQNSHQKTHVWTCHYVRAHSLSNERRTPW